MPFQNQELELIQLKQMFALKKIQEDLTAFNDIEIIQTLLEHARSMRLTHCEGSQPDIEKIDNTMRALLLSFDFAGMHNYDRDLHQVVFNCLILLGNYWPHNIYDYDAEEDGFVFKCPYSIQTITPENKLILPSGTQLDKTVLEDYIEFSRKDSYKDPIAQTSLDLNTINYICHAETQINTSWWHGFKRFISRPLIYDGQYENERRSTILHDATVGAMVGVGLYMLAMIVAAIVIVVSTPPFAPLLGLIFVGLLPVVPATGWFLGAVASLYNYNKSENAQMERVLPAEELHQTFQDNITNIEFEATQQWEFQEQQRAALANRRNRERSITELPPPNDSFWQPAVPPQNSVQSAAPPPYTSSTAAVSQVLGGLEEKRAAEIGPPPSYRVATSTTAVREAPAPKFKNQKREEWLIKLEARAKRSPR
jgi:hypothetical protein